MLNHRHYYGYCWSITIDASLAAVPGAGIKLSTGSAPQTQIVLFGGWKHFFPTLTGWSLLLINCDKGCQYESIIFTMTVNNICSLMIDPTINKGHYQSWLRTMKIFFSDSWWFNHWLLIIVSFCNHDYFHWNKYFQKGWNHHSQWFCWSRIHFSTSQFSGWATVLQVTHCPAPLEVFSLIS